MEIVQSTLSNGITLVTASMPHTRSVSVYYSFRIGARYEPPELAGICHFIEHMLFKGTANYPAARLLSEAIENVGGDFNGSTGKESTEYSVKLVKDQQDRAFDVLTDLVRRPLFDPQEIEKERRVIIEELHMYHDTPQDWVQVLLDEVVFPGHPLGREVIGTAETVGAITREQMLEFMATHYVPSALVISVAGDIRHADVLDAMRQRLEDWHDATPPRFVPYTAMAYSKRVRVDQRKTEQANLCLAFPGIGYGDPDYDALTVLSAILGEGMSSRLFQSVREDLGLVYDISSAVIGFHETGLFEITAGCEPARADAVIAATVAEVRRIQAEPPSAAEVRRIKDYVRGRLAISLEDTGSVASWLASQLTLRGAIRPLEVMLAQIDAVEVDDLVRVAQRLIVPQRLCLAAIGPLLKMSHYVPMVTW